MAVLRIPYCQRIQKTKRRKFASTEKDTIESAPIFRRVTKPACAGSKRRRI